MTRSLWIRTHSRHLECELLLDDRLVHLPDRSQHSGTNLHEKNIQKLKSKNLEHTRTKVTFIISGGLFAYFQISRKYLRNFEISGDI